MIGPLSPCGPDAPPPAPVVMNTLIPQSLMVLKISGRVNDAGTELQPIMGKPSSPVISCVKVGVILALLS